MGDEKSDPLKPSEEEYVVKLLLDRERKAQMAAHLRLSEVDEIRRKAKLEADKCDLAVACLDKILHQYWRRRP